MNAQFVNPWMLYFLWLAPAAIAWWVVAHRRRENRLRKFISDDMQGKLRPVASGLRRLWQSGLVGAGAGPLGAVATPYVFVLAMLGPLLARLTR